MKYLRKWSWRVCTSQNCRILFSFRLYWLRRKDQKPPRATTSHFSKKKKSEPLSAFGHWPGSRQTKVKSEREVIKEAQKERRTVYFATLMGTCHLKNAELEPKFQKCKGQVVLRGDIVKDDSGSHAVCTGQGSSASQMTAANVMDVIARLPGCARQAVDAVSAYTQVKMEDAPSPLKIPKSECPDIWIRLPETQMAPIMFQCGRSRRPS